MSDLERAIELAKSITALSGRYLDDTPKIREGDLKLLASSLLSVVEENADLRTENKAECGKSYDLGRMVDALRAQLEETEKALKDYAAGYMFLLERHKKAEEVIRLNVNLCACTELCSCSSTAMVNANAYFASRESKGEK